MDPRNFLFCSLDAALIADVARQVAEEGHEVRYYVEAASDREIGDGFVEKTDDWEAEVDWADVVVFDDIWVGSDVGTGALAQDLRADGHAVVGGTPNTDRLEDDRGYAMEILEEHGVNTVEHHVFRDFEAGIRHVREHPAPYVIKPLGEVQNVKRLLYVGREADGSDVVDVLRHLDDARRRSPGDDDPLGDAELVRRGLDVVLVRRATVEALAQPVDRAEELGGKGALRLLARGAAAGRGKEAVPSRVGPEVIAQEP